VREVPLQEIRTRRKTLGGEILGYCYPQVVSLS